MTRPDPPRGRATGANPGGRFERFTYDATCEPDLEQDTVSGPDDVFECQNPATEFITDTSRTIIARNDSEDVRFDASVNPYRGCEHGCVYCFARPFHEYLGYSAGLDFETKILVKHNAAELLRAELLSQKWKPTAIGLSGATDPYQPIERRLRITRDVLAVLADFRNPVIVITKNHLVTRDVDVLRELSAHQAAAVFVSVTTLDVTLARTMEPRTSSPQRRLDAITALARSGVPVGVLVAPIIPGLNDHEVPAILKAAAKAGATHAGRVMLRLPFGVKDIFSEWLRTNYPEREDRVLARVRQTRGGKLYDATRGTRMTGTGKYAEDIARMFDVTCRRNGLSREGMKLSTASFRRRGAQSDLFS